MPDTSHPRPPARLRGLISWQANKVNVVGSRLTAARMPLNARADFAVLAALEEFGAVSQADLGRRLGLDRNTVNDIVSRLDQAGRTHRATSSADRRSKTVSITPDGQRYLDELQATTDSVQAELTASLTLAETTDLKALLDKLLKGHPALPS